VRFHLNAKHDAQIFDVHGLCFQRLCDNIGEHAHERLIVQAKQPCEQCVDVGSTEPAAVDNGQRPLALKTQKLADGLALGGEFHLGLCQGSSPAWAETATAGSVEPRLRAR